MNKNTPYYVIAIGLFILLKFAYTVAGTNNLVFLLKPTNLLLELWTGSTSVYLKQSGYFFEQLNIVIDKSCSGYNFLLLCFLMLIFQTLKYAHTDWQKISMFFLSSIGAYFISIFVNSSRIYASIIIQNQTSLLFSKQQGIIHEAIGIITNLSFLILIYLITEKALTKIQGHAELT